MPSVKELVGANSLQSPLTQLRVGVESRRDDAVSGFVVCMSHRLGRTSTESPLGEADCCSSSRQSHVLVRHHPLRSRRRLAQPRDRNLRHRLSRLSTLICSEATLYTRSTRSHR